MIALRVTMKINDRHRTKCGGASECWPPLQMEHACPMSYEQTEEMLPFQSFCDESHVYISSDNYTISCLPHIRVNDKIDDCIRATDEPWLCHRTFNSYDSFIRFRCLKDRTCLRVSSLCDQNADCPLNDDEQFCKNQSFTCQQNSIEQILCKLKENNQHRIKFFSIITSSPYPILTKPNEQNQFVEIHKEKENSTNIKKNSKFSKEDQQWSHYCKSGIMIKKQINNGTSYECLYSSSYSDNFYQYENQRISLTLQLSSTNRYEIYSIIILLNNKETNEIVTFNRFQYIPKDSCTIKFHRILLY
ncbi:unnamed protein product [Adineta ricciae]|uniref:Uncharacterized protein n=1 Tax=Adineta ricciae TaxID=249248 RepID=A0A815V188_ADIRI|nr:unnamed protein product [Adineta ricciae]CAF1658641.1 unnamed protein product [Adineta ricciae]